MTSAAPPHAFVPRCLVSLVAAACRRPWQVLAVAAAVGAVSATAFYTRLEYRTQRTDLMSPHKDYQERWRGYLQEFGDDDDMVVVVEGADRGRMTAALEHVAAAVRAQPGRFDRLFYSVDLRHLRVLALLYLTADQNRPSLHSRT